MRPPRFFTGPNAPLEVYSRDASVGEELLARASQGEHRAEGYVLYDMIPGIDAHAVVGTRESLLYVSTGRRYSLMKWAISVKDIVHVVRRDDAVVITTFLPEDLQPPRAATPTDDDDAGTNGAAASSAKTQFRRERLAFRFNTYTIPCGEKGHARWLEQHLRTHVRRYVTRVGLCCHPRHHALF